MGAQPSPPDGHWLRPVGGTEGLVMSAWTWRAGERQNSTRPVTTPGGRLQLRVDRRRQEMPRFAAAPPTALTRAGGLR
jgi:hypothetical protein